MKKVICFIFVLLMFYTIDCGPSGLPEQSVKPDAEPPEQSVKPDAEPPEQSVKPNSEPPAKTEPQQVITHPVSSSIEESLNMLIEQLGSDDGQIRERATEELIATCRKSGDPARQVVKSALAKTNNVVVQVWLERVLSRSERSLDNLLYNPSFEKWYDDWLRFEKGPGGGSLWVANSNNYARVKIIKAEPGEAQDGSRYVEMTSSFSDWSALGQNVQSIIEPGVTYEVGLWYKTRHTGTFRLVMAEPFFMHSTDLTAIGSLQADGRWHYVSARFSRTARELKKEPMLGVFYDYSYLGTICFDQISLKKVAPAAQNQASQWEIFNDDIDRWERHGDPYAEIYFDNNALYLMSGVDQPASTFMTTIDKWDDLALEIEFMAITGSLSMTLKGSIPIEFPMQLDEKWHEYTIELKGNRLSINSRDDGTVKNMEVSVQKSGPVTIELKPDARIIIKKLRIKKIG